MSFWLAASLSKSIPPRASYRASELALRPALLAARHVCPFVFDRGGGVLGHRGYLPPLDADLALPVLRDNEVDLAELLVGAVEVEAPLGTPSLLALQRRAEDDLGDLDQVPDVLRGVPARVEEARPPHLDVGQPVLERQDLAEPLLEGVFVAHQVGVLHHRLLELLLHEVGALIGAARGLLERLEDARDLGPYLPLLYVGPVRALLDVPSRPHPGPPAEDEQVGERVPSQTVGPMQPAGALAGCEEAGHVGGARLGVDLYAAHRVVDGREDLHRLPGDVYVGELEELLVHGGQLLHDALVAEVRDVQVHAAVLATAALLHLGVVGPGHHVAGGELHPLGVVALHVALALGVAQEPALAAHALGNEQPAHAGGPDHPRRVELHHLHVHELGPCVVGEHDAVAGPLPRVGGYLEDAPPPARGHHHGLRLEVHEAPRLARVGQRADDATVAVLEEPGYGGLHVDVGAGREDLLLEGPDHLEPRAVADVAEPAVGVAAEGALGDPALRRPVEERAPLLELDDPLGGLLGERLDHLPVVEELPAVHSVDEVLAPGVVGVHVAHGGGYAALGHDGVRLAEQALGNYPDREAPLGRGYRRPEARAAGADDQDVVLANLVTPVGRPTVRVSICLHLLYLPLTDERQVGDDPRLQEPHVNVRQEQRTEAEPRPLRVPQVEAGERRLKIAPGGG